MPRCIAICRIMVPMTCISARCALVATSNSADAALAALRTFHADVLIANLKLFIPNLTKTIMLPGCGHWTQQERAHEVNAALIAFLHEVG